MSGYVIFYDEVEKRKKKKEKEDVWWLNICLRKPTSWVSVSLVERFAFPASMQKNSFF